MTMRAHQTLVLALYALCGLWACSIQQKNELTDNSTHMTAKDLLENPRFLAISYGGYRGKSREIQPTVAELKEDMKILSAMDVKILRTYNTKLAEASNQLAAIRELKSEDPTFEMYVMLGAWIDCKGDRKSTRLNSSHVSESRMPSSA